MLCRLERAHTPFSPMYYFLLHFKGIGASVAFPYFMFQIHTHTRTRPHNDIPTHTHKTVWWWKLALPQQLNQTGGEAGPLNYADTSVPTPPPLPPTHTHTLRALVRFQVVKATRLISAPGLVRRADASQSSCWYTLLEWVERTCSTGKHR